MSTKFQVGDRVQLIDKPHIKGEVLSLMESGQPWQERLPEEEKKGPWYYVGFDAGIEMPEAEVKIEAETEDKSFFGKVQQLHKTLESKGHVAEAQKLQKVAHYVPQEVPGVPSFWRRNYDYGEGFYCGNMSEKPGVKEWREKHKGKGPNMPEKKKTEKKAAWTDTLPGGKADTKKPGDFDPEEIKKGVEHELEHTDDRQMAKEIAMDHLAEDPKYYTHLDEMEEKVKREKETNDKIPGGLADKKPDDKLFDTKQMEMGKKVEMEHTDDPELAAEIARDHLEEHPDEYYTALKEMEKMLEKKKGRVDPILRVEALLSPRDLEILVEE